MTTHARTAGPSLWQEVVAALETDAQARASAAAEAQLAERQRRLVAFQKALVRWMTDKETTYWAPYQLDFELRALGVEVWQIDDGPRARYREAIFRLPSNPENTRELVVHLPCPTCGQRLDARGDGIDCLFDLVKIHLTTCCAGA